jgi:hypothetical protein
VARVRELSTLRTTGTSSHAVGAEGTFRLPLQLAANGVNLIVIEPTDAP